MRTIILSFVSAGLLLAACGGGDGGGGGQGATAAPPEPDLSPGGVWYGTVDSDYAGVVDVIGLVTETGQAIMIELDSGSLYSAALTVSGDEFQGSLKGYAAPGYVFANGSAVASGSLEGSIEERNRLYGIFSLAGSGGSFNLHYDRDAYEQPASLAGLAGNWGYQLSSGYAISLNIDANGYLYGSDTDGCQFSGNVSVPDARYNAYTATVHISSCPGADGTYNGLGTIQFDASMNSDYLLFGLSDGSRAYVDWFYRY